MLFKQNLDTTFIEPVCSIKLELRNVQYKKSTSTTILFLRMKLILYPINGVTAGNSPCDRFQLQRNHRRRERKREKNRLLEQKHRTFSRGGAPAIRATNVGDNMQSARRSVRGSTREGRGARKSITIPITVGEGLRLRSSQFSALKKRRLTSGCASRRIFEHWRSSRARFRYKCKRFR